MAARQSAATLAVMAIASARLVRGLGVEAWRAILLWRTGNQGRTGGWAVPNAVLNADRCFVTAATYSKQAEDGAALVSR